MEANRNQERTWNTFRMVAVAAGLWFLGSGIWGLLTETPGDRAVSGCEAAARAQAEPGTSVQHTASREEPGGWSVAGEVRRSVDNVATVTHQWECTADAEGRNPTISAWTPAG
ncbi:MAG: hypothetical protein KIT69_20655 [Propionibacteriaceae bacterium]|nr:hypothetical protein [Propionibacteriaceae bacterium]